MSGKKRVYRPSVMFEVLVAMLETMLTDLGIQFGDISAEGVRSLLETQRTESAADKAAHGRYVSSHEAFVRRQAQRWAKFMEAIETLRGRYRNDPAVAKRLAEIKRNVRHQAKKEEAASPTRVIRPSSEVA